MRSRDDPTAGQSNIVVSRSPVQIPESAHFFFVCFLWFFLRLRQLHLLEVRLTDFLQPFLARLFLFLRKQVQIAENEKWFPSKCIIYNLSANTRFITLTCLCRHAYSIYCWINGCKMPIFRSKKLQHFSRFCFKLRLWVEVKTAISEGSNGYPKSCLGAKKQQK